MDVVKTNMQKLNGRVDVSSTVSQGSRLRIMLPLTLASLIGWHASGLPPFGGLMQRGDTHFILAIDSFISQADVVIKLLQDTKSKGDRGRHAQPFSQRHFQPAPALQ